MLVALAAITGVSGAFAASAFGSVAPAQSAIATYLPSGALPSVLPSLLPSLLSGSSKNDCNNVFNGAATPSFTLSTNAGANNSTVVPGQTINIALRWNPSDFTSLPTKDDNCVEVNTTMSMTMSDEHKPPPSPGISTGTDSFSYTISSSAADGTQICDRATVSGNGPPSGVEKSNTLCYTVGPGTGLPESPNVIMLPISAIAVVGGGILVRSRRQRRRQGAA